jgi:hypothetical protein
VKLWRPLFPISTEHCLDAIQTTMLFIRICCIVPSVATVPITYLQWYAAGKYVILCTIQRVKRKWLYNCFQYFNFEMQTQAWLNIHIAWLFDHINSFICFYKTLGTMKSQSYSDDSVAPYTLWVTETDLFFKQTAWRLFRCGSRGHVAKVVLAFFTGLHIIGLLRRLLWNRNAMQMANLCWHEVSCGPYS